MKRAPASRAGTAQVKCMRISLVCTIEICLDLRKPQHLGMVTRGLLVGGEGEQPTPMGDVFVTTKVGSYREFGGRLYSTEQRQELMGAEQVITLIDADFGEIAPGVFELPPAIKTLAEAQAQ